MAVVVVVVDGILPASFISGIAVVVVVDVVELLWVGNASSHFSHHL